MEEITDLEIVKKHLHLFTGNILSFSRELFNVTGRRNPKGWEMLLHRIKRDDPDFLPAFEDPNDLIPQIWEGGHWIDLAKRLHRQKPDITVGGWEGRVKAARLNGALVRKTKDEYVIEHMQTPSLSPEDLWAFVSQASEKAIAGKESSRWADVHFNEGDKYIGIAFASDQHIGNKFCDHKRLKEDALLVAEANNCFIIHAGDYIDNFVVDKPRPAMKADIPPSAQWKLCEHYIDLHGESLFAIVAGNHDLWTSGLTDYDPLGKLASERGILYHKHELNIRAHIGGQKYHLSIRHKRRGNSSLHPARVIKAMWSDGEQDFDIGVVGHHHTPVIENFTRHGIERWAIRPGAYKVLDAYAEMLGFAQERPSCPMVILSPYDRQIQAFSDLRTGLRTLKMLNGEYHGIAEGNNLGE
tara:strand:+ start:16261 stop:17496 length:1236 start_codon:yes stop_codon:yes gene_type:complete